MKRFSRQDSNYEPLTYTTDTLPLELSYISPEFYQEGKLVDYDIWPDKLIRESCSLQHLV